MFQQLRARVDSGRWDDDGLLDAVVRLARVAPEETKAFSEAVTHAVLDRRILGYEFVWATRWLQTVNRPVDVLLGPLAAAIRDVPEWPLLPRRLEDQQDVETLLVDYRKAYAALGRPADEEALKTLRTRLEASVPLGKDGGEEEAHSTRLALPSLPDRPMADFTAEMDARSALTAVRDMFANG